MRPQTKYLFSILVFFLFAGEISAEVESLIIGVNGNPVKVRDFGLVTNPFSNNASSHAFLSTVNGVQNMFKDLIGNKFIIDCIILSGDRNIAANADATLLIYASTSAFSRVQTEQIYLDKVSRGERFGICGLKREVPKGLFVNAETDDSTISLNILGYFIPSE